MKIKSAEFLMSNSDVSKCPKERLPEYAFIGRSNVGKSSLINMLADRKNLAKTSGKPGKTQLINHFVINKSWYLVDLPRYGHARVSKKAKKTFQKFITDYFEKRAQLVLAFVLIDCRHEPQPVDIDFMRYLAQLDIPFQIIFTKADKLKPKALATNLETYTQKMLESWEEMPAYYVTSSSKKQGKEIVLDNIKTINQQLKDIL